MSVRIQQEAFDIGVEVAAMKAGDTAIGAVVTFTGVVRDMAQGSAITEMTLEHYPGMTENELQDIERAAHTRWPLQRSLIIHRVGTLRPGDDIVLVATASAHRAAAFEAAEFLMDFLKTRAPLWKNEKHSDGRQKWVDERACDTSKSDRWKTS